MVGEMGSISHLIIRKLHIQTYINDVFKRDNVKYVPSCLLKRNNVFDQAPQNCMTFTDHLISLGHGSNDGPTGHPGIFFEHKENFNLPIACSFPFWIGNSEAVSPWHSLIHLRMQNCITNLQSLKKGDTFNRLHPKKQQKVVFKWCTRCAFL